MSVGKRVAWGVLVLSSVFFLLLIGSDTAFAQASASITGRVEDASGGAVPGAAVTVTNEETGNARTATSDDSGNFSVPTLPVGHYTIKAEKSGFKTLLRQGITLAVGQEAVTNLSMEVGGVAQEVTVTAEAPLVNTTTASIAGLVDEKQVKDLPLNGRSFDMLLTLNSGAAPMTSLKATTGNATQSGNLFTISGRSFFENQFTFNGVEYTGPSQAHVVPGGASGELLGIDAVREFNVLADAYGAEYGKRAGAQISVVTQSGGNALHGSLFEFMRNSVLDARNFFDHPVGRRIPPYERNQFGAALGGPIRKDKTFIFGNYEALRSRWGLSILTFVPDSFARQGLMDNSTTPYPTVVPGMLPYFGYWPAPTVSTIVSTGIGEAFSNPLQHIREDFGNIRIDHNFSSKDQLAGIYTIDDGYNETPQTDPLFDIITTLRTQIVSIAETHLFSPSLINTATVGYSRAGYLHFTPPYDPSTFPSAALSMVTGQVPGRLSISASGAGNTGALTLAGSAIDPLYITYRNLFTYEDGLQWIRGRHELSFGIWFQHVNSNEFGDVKSSGQATFSSIPLFLAGTVASFQVTPTQVPMDWNQLLGAWYVQDNMRVRPNLTVRFGLRFEFTDGWNEAHGRGTNYLYGSNGIIISPPMVGNSVLTQNNATHLLAPRVGIAWDPFGKGKTSIRASGGIYYDLQDNLGYVLDQTPPYNGTPSFTNANFLSLVPFNPTIPTPPSCGPGVTGTCTTFAPYGFQPNFKTPTIEEWNLTLDQQITPNTSFRLAYDGSFGFHEILSIDTNTIQPQICANAAGCIPNKGTTATIPQGTLYVPVSTLPNPYVASCSICWMSSGNSSYNALVVEVTHRVSAGLQFKANYTWSKSMDLGTGLITGDQQNVAAGIQDPYNLKADWGPSGINSTNKFAFSGGYELPFGPNKPWLSASQGPVSKLVGGWQFNWILTLLDGYPLDLIAGSNRSANGESTVADRPNLTPGFTSVATSGTTGPANPALGTTTAVPQGFACAGVPANERLGTPDHWYNPCAMTLEPAGTFGNMGRDTVPGPGFGELDMSLFKTTTIRENMRLQFRVECFNVTNRPNFNPPSLSVFSGTTPTAGSLPSTSDNSRQIQLGLKLMF